MKSIAEAPAVETAPAPEPRVVPQSSRVRRPEPLASDFELEAALGWKRFAVRGIDRCVLSSGEILPRAFAYPEHYILAPDEATAKQTYLGLDEIRTAAEGINRDAQKHIKVVCNVLDD